MEKITVYDPATGVWLHPIFHGISCPGNGEQPEIECCCDECDYFLFCFPDWKEYDAAIDAYLKK